MNEDVLIIIRHKLGRKRLLTRALKSVSNQTYKNVKVAVLCMDFYKRDLNENSYLNICDKNESTLIEEGEFNDFFKSSDAKFFCFLDDDDSWAPEYLSRLISLLSITTNKYPSVQAVACHTNKVNEVCEGNRIIINDTQPWNHYLSAGPLEFDTLQYINSLPLSSCVFLKKGIADIINNHNINSPIFSWPFIIEFLSKHDIWIVPEALSFYHFREKNDSEFGNFTILNGEIRDIEYKIKINSMMRGNSNTSLLNALLGTLLNKTTFHRISSIERNTGRN
ncbi:glycosyltransferase family A protein [Rosenbergiella nectarea]|uniref:glycosyltransferase family A protein n=1 Tax=Rosenbergiella nectarea TaxID=988801 RepID=UPI001F4DE0D2|nr:glycosyltransferase family A protein [Rosenbergiella nectarea]